MSEISTDLGQPVNAAQSDTGRAGWLAFGGVIGAFLASACCIVPLLLVTLGISGAWIGNLTVLEPYKPFVSVVTLGLLGFGFWHVYGRAKPVCADGSYCARPESSLITQSALSFATILVVLALTINWWAPFFY